MSSFRRPWPISRKDTDSVALNTLEGDGKKTAQENTIEVGASTSNMGEPSDKSSGSATPGEMAEEDLKMFQTLHQWDPNLERKSTVNPLVTYAKQHHRREARCDRCRDQQA